MTLRIDRVPASDVPELVAIGAVPSPALADGASVWRARCQHDGGTEAYVAFSRELLDADAIRTIVAMELGARRLLQPCTCLDRYWMRHGPYYAATPGVPCADQPVCVEWPDYDTVRSVDRQCVHGTPLR